ncbi:MAG: HD domain-containing protein [Pirellulales bacterium]
MAKALPILKLGELIVGEEADAFALLYQKEELKTKDGKPYFKVGFRDATREFAFPIWNDSEHAERCRKEWQVGAYYKLRCVLRETNFGPQLDLHKVRETNETDPADGFDPDGFRPQSRFDPEELFGELCAAAEAHIENVPLRRLTLKLLIDNKAALLTLPAATRNHHAFSGGFLEHVASVVKNAVFFSERYAGYYTELTPPLDKGLIVAGAILHDIGKLRELEWQPEGPAYTPAGSLIGHVLQGRDMVREAALELAHEAAAAQDAKSAETGDLEPLDAETLLRLEHIIVSHQRLPEWGAPKPPMTPEAMLVHYADDLDAKMNMVVAALLEDKTPGHTTSKKNVLMQQFYRGNSGR